MEKNMLEAARDNGGFSTPLSSPPPVNTGVIPLKGKSKGRFTTFDQSELESDDEQETGAHTAAGHSDWFKPGSGYKFPCPLQNHDHEVAAYMEFLILTPKDHWIKIPKGRIQYTCLNPKELKGVCKNKRCSEEKGIPQVLLCAACTPWAAGKGWEPFSVLMCRKPEHGHNRPKPADPRNFLRNILEI